MDIIVFGLGQHYQKNKQKLSEIPNLNIIFMSDNNASLWGQVIDDAEVLPPEELRTIDFDYIVVANWLYRESIKQQLCAYGISKNKVLEINEFLQYLKKGDLQVFLPQIPVNYSKAKILFISTDLGHNGGSLAIVYAALASKTLGFVPTILVPSVDINMVNGLTQEGITLIIYPDLNNASIEELCWVEGYSYYVVNTLQMMLCAKELVKKYKVIWWLHEPKYFYEDYKNLFDKCNKEVFEKLGIYSVTKKAKANFDANVSGILSKELLLGIPDRLLSKRTNVGKNKKIIFAVVGGISETKGQDLLLKAIEIGSLSAYEDVEFWFIGVIPETEFTKNVLKILQKYPKVKVIGPKTRKEMEQLYSQIDVIVVCSREETLSMVAIEAMMYKKVCIISDACGVVAYIDGVLKEFVYPWENAGALAGKISWCIENKGRLSLLGEEGRKIYEQKFSMEVFSERLRTVFSNIKNEN